MALQPLTPQEVNLTTEEVAFSFSTSSAPAILLYVSTKTEDYLAIVLRQNGVLQMRYQLGGQKEPFSVDVDQRNLANGQPHSVNMTRVNRTITVQLDHYPPVSYSLPESSDTQMNLVKTLFLGRVFGECPCSLIFVAQPPYNRKCPMAAHRNAGKECVHWRATEVSCESRALDKTVDRILMRSQNH
ncbi:contactin-associated protein-like 2 [Osmerus eperlanus]|uniref:contactin-associated protein-like 2 n=1 Tax=Osmerus eperlanus TaxID=29151 RepID=UPI002E0FA720